jgi:ADP-sugar diphosphatase
MENNGLNYGQSALSMPMKSENIFQDKVTTVSGRNMFGPGGNISKNDALTFAFNLPAFGKWKSKLESSFGKDFKGISIMDVFPFGPAKTARGGFVIANASVSKGGKPVPGFAFIRGGAVAILPVLENESGAKFVLTLIQPRVPGAEKDYEEIPAGMLDGGAFGGVAAKEMKEETGLTVKESDLTPLSLMYPSIGGCDENIKVFLYRAKLSDAAMTELQGKATGNPDENESIITKLTPYDEFKQACLTSKITDVKAQVALGMYEMMMSSMKDMEGKDWKPVVNAMSGGRRKHTRKAKHHKKRGTRKH